jgi:hypothetical protein
LCGKIMVFKGNKLALLKVLKTSDLIFVTLKNLNAEYRIREGKGV